MLNNISKYASPIQQAEALAISVASQLIEAIESKDSAILAVAGGQTPALFFEYLSRCQLDWTKVVITTTDERFVPKDSPRSNARLVAENLLINEAAEATFLALCDGEATPDLCAKDASSKISKLLPVDVCVLGMGADMHIASLFPDTPGLEEAISADSPHLVLPMTPPTADEVRLTLTLPVLMNAKNLHILIVGSDKLDALNQSETIQSIIKAPVKSVLMHKMLQIHYAEKVV
ncbi:MAG: 6-phosphogluconolactonase [Hyphomicrobiales bacterium]